MPTTEPPPTPAFFGRFELDFNRRVLLAGGKPVDLQSRSFDILALLVASRGRVVSQEEILTTVWKGQVVVANNLTVQMSLLRRALAEHGAPTLIVTLPRKGYRFVGQLNNEFADNSCPESTGAAKPHSGAPVHPFVTRTVLAGGLGRRWRVAAVLGAGAMLGAGTALGFALASHAVSREFAPRVQVDAKPDTIVMTPGGYCHVDYVFQVLDKADLQLATEDVRFYLQSGEPVSAPAIRGRIYHGSFAIRGSGLGIYHNNIWLPDAVAAAAKANGRQSVYLRHLFHLTELDGKEVNVPAVLQINFGPPEQACSSVK